MELIEHVASLIEAVPDESDLSQGPSSIGIRVDRYGHPLALLLPWRRHGDRTGHQLVPITLRVPASAGPVDVARRASHATGPAASIRWSASTTSVPLSAIIRIERLITHLADHASRNGSPGGDLLFAADNGPGSRTGTPA